MYSIQRRLFSQRYSITVSKKDLIRFLYIFVLLKVCKLFSNWSKWSLSSKFFLFFWVSSVDESLFFLSSPTRRGLPPNQSNLVIPIFAQMITSPPSSIIFFTCNKECLEGTVSRRSNQILKWP